MTLRGVPYFVHRTPGAEVKHVSLCTGRLHRASPEVKRPNSPKR